MSKVQRYNCTACEDWGTVVAEDGNGTVPCPVQCPATVQGRDDAEAGEQQ